MRSKFFEKEKAIKLRKKGYSYSEILKSVGVSRSTLSEWLRHVTISNIQIDRLRLRNEKARKLGSIALKIQRITKSEKIIKQSIAEIGNIDINTLRIIGATLYWTEGSKQNEHEPSKELIFTNSDPKMIRTYLLWLVKCLSIKNDDIKFEIYIHETYNKTSRELSEYWSKVTGFTSDKLSKIYFKKNKVNSYRKNKGEYYNGVLRVTVRKSTDINRKVMGWIEGICLQSGVNR